MGAGRQTPALQGLALAAAALWALTQPTAAVADDGIDRAEVARTWEQASVALPGTLTGGRPVLGRWDDAAVRDAVAGLPATARAPAVIYLHGCTGIGREGESARLILMRAGYAVFMPDSFARTRRSSNCARGAKVTPLFPDARRFRLEEIDLAVARVRALPWIDPDRVYLAGFSEGAMAVAQSARRDVAGAVILAWHCQGPDGFHGLRLPAEVPVLAVVADRDPWYRHAPGRHCGPFLAGRPRSRSLVLSQDSHEILGAPDTDNAAAATRAVLAFLAGD